MNRFERTVVALTATDADRALLSYARMLARMGLGRHYDFVHVRTPARKADEPEDDAAILQKCQEMVASEFTSPDRDVSCDCQLLDGVRVDKLIEFIIARRADLVLVGHRKSRSGQRSLGRRLAMIAPCSVWLVPEGALSSITNIMVPFDFSHHSADSMVVAASLAKAAGLTECLGTHVFADASFIRYDERIHEIRYRERESFEEFIAPLDLQGIHVRAAFLEGNNIGGTLLYSAERNGIDLIVMNTRGRSRAASILLGSVTGQVMTKSPVAVLAVKHAGAMMSLFQVLQESKSWMQPSPKTN